jgi:hypothetical protein
MSVAFAPDAPATTRAPSLAPLLLAPALIKPVMINPIANWPGLSGNALILTKHGERPVKSLRPGDKIVTRDRGFQPLRWIGQSQADTTVIEFAAGAFGNEDPLFMAPETRLLLRSALAQALFDSAEVFVRAVDLVNGDSIRPTTQNAAPLMHLLFPHHELIRVSGIEVESLHPEHSLTDQTDAMRANSPQEQHNLRDSLTGSGFTPPARVCLTPAEARSLIEALA